MIVKFCLLFLLPLTALASESTLVLWYVVNEPGFEPYRVRYLISDDFLRSDDGQAGDDFVLLSRKEMKVYNIVHDTESILEIKGGANLPKTPASFSADETVQIAKDAPAIAGKSAKEYQLTVDKKACFRAMVLPGLYMDAAKAFQQFAVVLATQQFRSLEHTPDDMISTCFIARAIYMAGNHSETGLPVIEWDDEGFSRQLVDYSEETIPAELFDLPEKYSRYTPGGQ